MYFEQFKPGDKYTTQSRLVESGDIDIFLKLSGLTNPIFMDDRAAREAGHPGRLAPAPMLLSLAMGLTQQTGLFDHVAAVLQFDRLRFVKSVYPGDSLTIEVQVASVRPTKNPDRGLVVLNYTGMNQDGETVFTTEATYLMRRDKGA